jgi:hypothetical protein
MQVPNSNLNYAREFVSRLQNVCYNHTVVQVINAMAQNTNFDKKTYYGGRVALMRQTHLSSAGLKSALRKLTLDGVIQRVFTQKELFTQGIRQNYKLIIPPVGLVDCSEWDGHNQMPHHLDGYSDLITRLRGLSEEEERLRIIQERKKPPLVREIMPNEEDEDNFNW